MIVHNPGRTTEKTWKTVCQNEDSKSSLGVKVNQIVLWLKLNSKNPPTLSYDNQVLQLLHTASTSPVFALEKSQPLLHSLLQSAQASFCNVSPSLRDTITFVVFSLWFFLHFVQVTSRVILSYMSRESNTTEPSLLSSQGPGLKRKSRGTAHPWWKSC